MLGLTSMFLKTLGVTPDGRCAKHPHISLVSDDKATLKECDCCWKEHQEMKDHSAGELSNNTTSVESSLPVSAESGHSDVEQVSPGGGIPAPSALASITSGASFPTSSPNYKAKTWMDSVMARCTQVQEIGFATTNLPLTGAPMEDNSGLECSFHESCSINPLLLASMHVLAEEPSEEHGRRSPKNGRRHVSPVNSRKFASVSNSVPTKEQWNRLEEQVQLQDSSIQRLQDTIQQQESAIRQDLQQLMHLVSGLAAAASNHDSIPYLQQLGEEEIDPYTATPTTSNVLLSGQKPSATSHTRLMSNLAIQDDNHRGHIQEEPEAPRPPQRPKERPGMYDKNFSHPANIFTSVRTIERKPPKPPMRHGSFSTLNKSQRTGCASVASSGYHLGVGDARTIVSSLGNSTYGDTTYNDTTTNNDTSVSVSVSKSVSNDKDPLEIELDNTRYFGAGLETFMLEKERSKPLDIIFDASGMISTEFRMEEAMSIFKGEEESNTDNDGEEKDEEKKSSTGSSGSSPKGGLSKTASGPGMNSSSGRTSVRKTRGTIHLEIPEEENEDEGSGEQKEIPLNQDIPQNEAPRQISPGILATGRYLRKPPPGGPHRANTTPSSAMQLRQPKREASIGASINNKPRLPGRGRNTTFPSRTSTYPGPRSTYVPPPPPPGVSGGGDGRGADEQASAIGSKARLHPSNLSKLGKNTAPPRREIFAKTDSKFQISTLTIDTSLLSENEPANQKYDRAALSATMYLEVTNFPVTDKFGDKGVYTGTLREEEIKDSNGNAIYGADQKLDQDASGNGGDSTSAAPMNLEGKQVARIPHGTGTMKYEEGRFYKGDWRDGHWHGNGLLRNANGDSYEGDFVYDARHGRGIYKYENGDVYEGDFTEDRRHGKGTFLFHNGSVYRGDFVDGNFEGYGWYEFADGYYEGEWKGGAYDGIGTLQYIDGGSYTGRFAEGKAHGMGEERDADGTIRRGMWNMGELSDTQ